MDIPLSLHYKGRVIVIEAKTDEDKRRVEELVNRKDWAGLERYIIQYEEWSA